jgi:hypothetical protein
MELQGEKAQMVASKSPPVRGQRFSKPQVGRAFAEMYRRRKIRDDMEINNPENSHNPQTPSAPRSVLEVAQQMRRSGKVQQAKARARFAKRSRDKLDAKNNPPDNVPDNPQANKPIWSQADIVTRHESAENGAHARNGATKNVRAGTAGDNSRAASKGAGSGRRGPMMSLNDPLYRDAEIETALRYAMGNLSKACAILAAAEEMVTGRKCDPISRESLASYISRVPYLCEALDDIRERNMDLLEDKFWAGVKAGNPAMIMFGLKCHGKARGWIESARGELDYRAGYGDLAERGKSVVEGKSEQVDIRQLPRHLQDNLGELLLAIERMPDGGQGESE